MLQKLIKLFFKKEIILYENHRNVRPVIDSNKGDYFFIKTRCLTRLSKSNSLLTLSKNKNKIQAFLIIQLLNIIKPKAIIACNWLTLAQKTYYLYSRRTCTQFIVIQHGAYKAGWIRNDHRFMKCDKFLVWGEYFKNIFDDYNSTRKDDIIVFGNPVYNIINRDELQYPKQTQNILVALSFMDDAKLETYKDVVRKLSATGLNACIKYHNKQKKKLSLPLNAKEVYGKFTETANKADVIIVDHSSTLLDSVFFKKFVVYVNCSDKSTIYNKFLKNHFATIVGGNFSIESLTDKKAQEALLQHMVYIGNNDLKMLFD
jgi:hypothetical protein